MGGVLAALAAAIGAVAAQVGYIACAERVLERLPSTRGRALRPWLWLTPAFGFIAIFLLYPALNTGYLSAMGPRSEQFVGLENYRFVFTNRDMLVAFRNNLLWLTLFTAITVGLGLAMAALTDRVRYESLANSALFLPMAISFVAAAVIWKFVYEFRPAGAPQIGALNALLTGLLPNVQPVAWLVNRSTNNLALIGVAAWVWVGFCLVIFSAAIKGIPSAILDAARADGATEWQVFARITVPMLAPTVAVVATTMVIYSLKAFDIVYVMTSGNFGTEVIANRMYKEMFTFRDFGRASAIAVVLFVATAPVLVANIRRWRRQEAAR
jgi:alpha-glucoside transport system permease protein